MTLLDGICSQVQCFGMRSIPEIFIGLCPSCRLGKLEVLPEELLELMLSFLNVPSLCTARLVSKAFFKAASLSLRSLTLSTEDLRSRPLPGFNNVPKLARLTIRPVEEGDNPMLAHPNICEAVTELNLVLPYKEGPGAQTAAPTPLPGLPNLRAITISGYSPYQCLPFPPTLRALVLHHPVAASRAEPVMRLTTLTSLHLSLLQVRPLAFTALEGLSGLQRLEIRCGHLVISSLGTRASLTHLVWAPDVDVWDRDDGGPECDLAPFTRLKKLVHLGFGASFSGLTPEHLALIGRITTIRSLDLAGVKKNERHCLIAATAMFLGHLALTRLSVNCHSVDVSVLSMANMKGLLNLTLRNPGMLSQEGVFALGRPTGLTHLEFIPCRGGRLLAVESFLPVLSHLSGLQSLFLQGRVAAISCERVVRIFPGLTRLRWAGGHVTIEDVAACARLSKLRVLSLLPNQDAPCGSLTPGGFSKLAKRPQLAKLGLSRFLGNQVDYFSKEVRTLVNSERHSRGWPPLDLTMKVVLKVR
jgi:hypothetical protein